MIHAPYCGRSLLALLAALLLIGPIGCSSTDDGAGRGSAADDDDQDDDDASDDDDQGDCPNPYCVYEDEDIGADWDCEAQHECVADYLAFVALAAEHGAPISPEQLEDQLDAIEDGQVAVLDELPAGQELAQLVPALINVDFLRQGINQRPLYVTTIRRDEGDGYAERELLLRDPYVGTFKAIILEPDGQGPFPAIVALHGHNDAPAVFRDLIGAEFAQNGYVIIMIALRAMAGGELEDLVTRSMLLGGFSMMGIRDYETLLALKYLQYLPDVDETGVGLIGHSGGSVASNLTIRYEDGFAALVSDCIGEYCSRKEGLLYDETVPALYPYHELINARETGPAPVLVAPYGFYDAHGQIFEFFDEYLKH